MTQENILVLGIGNLLWADDGFGVRAVEELHRQWRFPERVRLMDGGTHGFGLLPHVQEARRVIVFDAIDCGLPPGTIRVLENGEVPRYLRAGKMSLHQTGFQEVLAMAELTETHPVELVLIGIQPATVDDYGGKLDPVVRAGIPGAVAIGLSWLQRWGCKPEPRTGGLDPLLPAILSMSRFEEAVPTGGGRCV